MGIDPLEPIDRLDPPHVLDGPWWSGTVSRVMGERVELGNAITPLDRDPRAEALGIAQHATAFIPTPLVTTTTNAAAARRRRRT